MKPPGRLGPATSSRALRERLEAWAVPLVGAVVLLVGLLVWRPTPVGVWHDDGVYLVTAKALARGEGLRYHGVVEAPPAAKFPPVYPLTLAAAWRLGPEFPRSIPLLEILNLLYLAAAAALLAGFAHRRLELPLPWAVGGVLLAWLSVDLWRFAAIPLSESLFVLTMVVAVVLGTSMERDPSARSVGLFLAAFAVAVHTRTVGVVLGVAGVVALALRRRVRTALATAAGVVAVCLPWLVWSGRAADAIPPPLRDILGPYGEWLVGQVVRDPVGYLAGLPGQALDLGSRLTPLLLPGVPGAPARVGALMVGVVAAVGLWASGRRSWTFALAAPGYLALVLLWPFQDRRLLAPAVPWIVFGAVVGVRRLVAAAGRTRRARLAVAGAGLLWAAWFAGWSAWALASGRHEAGYAIRSGAILEAVEAVRLSTPPDAVVGAPEMWAALHLYTGRTVSPSARFLPLARAGPVWGTPAEQYELWQEAGLEYLVVEHGRRVHGEALDRVEAVCPAGTLQVLAAMEGQWLVRLAWDAACRRALASPEEGP